MADFPDLVLERLTTAINAHRDVQRAAAMAAYMRNQFPFAGIPGPVRVVLQREVLANLGNPSGPALLTTAERLWELPDREFQYAGCDLLRRHVSSLAAGDLTAVRELITRKSWWDTVDSLAAHVVGGLVGANPELLPAMDEWSNETNIWLVRSAIIHQLRFKAKTDTTRLFAYCEQQAGHPDFFVRKAIGWALREYSKTDPAAVRKFVSEHAASLSGLSQREALLRLNGGRRKATG
jgi:3-methyladenine DNA glycosylase AlkD